MLEDYNLFLEHLFLEHPNVRKGIKGKDSRKEELVRTMKHDSDICFTTAGSLSALSSLGYT